MYMTMKWMPAITENFINATTAYVKRLFEGKKKQIEINAETKTEIEQRLQPNGIIRFYKKGQRNFVGKRIKVYQKWNTTFFGGNICDSSLACTCMRCNSIGRKLERTSRKKEKVRLRMRHSAILDKMSSRWLRVTVRQGDVCLLPLFYVPELTLFVYWLVVCTFRKYSAIFSLLQLSSFLWYSQRFWLFLVSYRSRIQSKFSVLNLICNVSHCKILMIIQMQMTRSILM